MHRPAVALLILLAASESDLWKKLCDAVPKDPARATALLKRACDAADKEACDALAAQK